jgi:hypothetical protein
MNNKQTVQGISCDLEKAFVCVDHDILLSKLKLYGINGKDTLKLLYSIMIKPAQLPTGLELVMEFHKGLYWDRYCFYYSI